MSSFDMVAAADEGRGLGKDGQLPWKLPGDMAFFKRITSDTESPEKRNAVIMGRKTWETIPPRYQPLDKRLNVVLTRQSHYEAQDGVIVARSLEQALSLVAQQDGIERIFVIGGGEIYALGIALRECQRIYLTRVQARFACDAHFPVIGDAFELTDESERHEDNGIGYVFQTWTRRR